MIKRLRNKFIVLSLTSVLLVLVMIIGAINYINYSNVCDKADGVLSILAENSGTFPRGMMKDDLDHKFDKDHKPGEGPNPSFGNNEKGNASSAPDKPGDRRDLTESPETPFESRYFTITLDSEGNIVDSDMDMVAAIDENTARSYAEDLNASNKTRGFISDYRYTVIDAPVTPGSASAEGSKMYIFLDCARSLSNYQAFLYASIEVAAMAFLLVALLIVLVSRHIVKPVAESYDKQKRFITDAGHEIKTPLTIIEADAAVLEMESGQNEWLDDIKNQTARLATLTKDLIYLSRMDEKKKTQVNNTDFSLSELLSATCKSYESRALAGNKDYSYEIEEGLNINGDKDALEKLSNILLDNAFKYSVRGDHATASSGSEPDDGTVRFTAKKTGKQIKITVYNTADNIIKEELPNMFDRFYRGDKSRNSETGGYGIGLSIAQAIVNAHKGKISAGSEDEKSLTIVVSLPL